MIGILLVPELSNLLPDNKQAWIAWLTTAELKAAVLCLIIAYHVQAWRLWFGAAAVWLLTQAADEATNKNIFTEQLWEYPLLVAFLIAVHLINKARK